MNESASAKSNRRRHQRHRVKLPITFEFADQTWDVYALNLSTGGMLVETEHAVPEQQTLDFLIWLGDRSAPHTEVLKMSGTVVHLGEGIGMGIRFDRIDDNSVEMRKLASYLESMQQQTPDSA